MLPKHFLPNIVRLCGKLEMLDRLLPKLKATGHRVFVKPLFKQKKKERKKKNRKLGKYKQVQEVD
jgi:hypothetical protein